MAIGVNFFIDTKSPELVFRMRHEWMVMLETDEPARVFELHHQVLTNGYCTSEAAKLIATTLARN